MSKTFYDLPAPPPVLLGDWLHQEREKRGLTLAAVAASVGVNLSLVQKWEKGRRLLTASQAAKLARLFEADSAEIEVRRVVQEINHYYGDNPATPKALLILNDLPVGRAVRTRKIR